MFYRYTKAGSRIAVDLDGMYEGETLFLLGGNPALRAMPLDLLRQAGVITMGINNVPCMFKPNLWIGADKPPCFSPHIYTSPEITKFTMISRRELEVPGTGKKLREFPGIFFFGAIDGFTYQNFLEPNSSLVWWRSTFPMALQLAYRLGFKRVFLVGCAFHMNRGKGAQYAWDTSLTQDQATYSHNTYSKDLGRLKALLPTFERHGFQVVSSTPRSAAHSMLDYVPLEEAVAASLEGKPLMAETNKLLHSSVFRAQAAAAVAAK